MAYKSGEQYNLEYKTGDGVLWELTVASVGAAIRELKVNGEDVTVPFDADEVAPCFDGQVLFPWPNRLEDGEYEFEGVKYSAPINEPDKHNQLHSFSPFYSFECVEKTDHLLHLRLEMLALQFYPFLTRLDLFYKLDDNGLAVKAVVENIAEAGNAPVALAFHPWFAHSNGEGGALDDCSLKMEANKFVELNSRLLPTEDAETSVTSTKFDLRSGASLDGVGFDDPFVDLDFEGGKNVVEFTRADGRLVSVWCDEGFTSWQVCSGDGFKGARRRASLAIEPQTAYCNAFKTGQNLTVLAPGETLTAKWGVNYE